MPSKTAKSNSHAKKRLVVFVVYPNVKLLDLAGPLQAFSDATDNDGNKPYQAIVTSVSGGLINTDTSTAVATQKLADLKGLAIDTLVLVGGGGVFDVIKDRSLLAVIKRLAKRSRRIASICTGAFVLAECGLLDGHKAVTHWEYCDALDQYPSIEVMPDRIYVNDKNRWTSAGVTAGIDMAITMISIDVGRAASLRLAKLLVTYLVRPGGQSQFSQPLSMQFSDRTGKFDELHQWLANNLRKDLKVEHLANYVSMSPRNFSRSYLAATGLTPAKGVERIRMDAACRLLESRQLSVATVAAKCGFGDDERMRRSFVRYMKLSPQQYRDRFC